MSTVLVSDLRVLIVSFMAREGVGNGLDRADERQQKQKEEWLCAGSKRTSGRQKREKEKICDCTDVNVFLLLHVSSMRCFLDDDELFSEQISHGMPADSVRCKGKVVVEHIKGRLRKC